MEHTSDTVYDGKLLHETSYPQRAEQYTEIELSATLEDGTELRGKVDFYDAKQKVIHETKRSNKVEAAHEWQCRFYIWLLELNNVEGAHAVLEYPKLRKTEEVWLSSTDKDYLMELTEKIKNLVRSDDCPPRIDHKICKSCSYFDLCYAEEEWILPADRQVLKNSNYA